MGQQSLTGRRVSPRLNDDGDDASMMIAMLSQNNNHGGGGREKSEMQSQVSIMEKIKDRGAKLLGYIFGGNQNEGGKMGGAAGSH